MNNGICRTGNQSGTIGNLTGLNRKVAEAFFGHNPWQGFFDLADSSHLRPAFRIDAYENQDTYRVVAELVGVGREDISLRYEENTLIIELTVRSGADGNDKDRQYTRSVRFASPVSPDEVSAQFADGLLVVSIPKASEFKPREISIA